MPLDFKPYLLLALHELPVFSVPGIGTFVRKRERARIDAQAKQLLPPTESVELKRGDEALAQFVDFLAQHAGISQPDAEKLAKEIGLTAVQFIQSLVEIELEGFGTLKKGAYNLPVFEPVTLQDTTASYGLPKVLYTSVAAPLSQTAPPKAPVTPPPAPKEDTKPEPKAIVAPDPKTEPKAKPEPAVKQKPQPLAKAATTVPTAPGTEEPAAPKPKKILLDKPGSRKAQPKAKAKPAPAKKSRASAQVAENKKGGSRLLAIVAVVLLVAIAAIVVLKFDDIKAAFGGTKQATTAPADAGAEPDAVSDEPTPAAADTTPKEKPKPSGFIRPKDK